MRSVSETGTYLTLQSKCLVIVDVLMFLLGVIVWTGHSDFRFLSALLILSGTLGSIIGTGGCLAKTGDEKYSTNFVVRFCTKLFSGDVILVAGIPLILVSIVTCAFSIFTFHSTTLTFRKAPASYALLISSVALAILSVVVASSFFKSVLDHQRTVGASRQQYHPIERVKESVQADITSEKCLPANV
ncbi:uncharacterized protein LOC110446204 [Mizuhopecten yessoensis]|uniref:Transmembrane protein n=1 Tax=Mizuhopecten yessoensis TaxID=6573 RepID=A0A210QXV1_MIZYE|nr:uncharacterized protein LOC110446204 [Mizuhopecten yessoensis]XP_021346911.1 uncharacterized protein LOC110446204 [Mizuhopecten yessoensis]XP_021346912.1 uncharacterized protein LOC110446204 [Mizuhopecten yessoensis]XP_021346913.1 uncharacterized protein LOC110446204 [Mizuhopecten yessoensis]XP_021346914.1 uncharacterized protein LOC110446204 [Mizuhopecten yessoensis]OWF53588.1 hypothetical protein KP79_PYT20032 [Mizuhopecten yessoensis]